MSSVFTLLILFLLNSVSHAEVNPCTLSPSVKNPLIVDGCIGELCEDVVDGKSLHQVDLLEKPSVSSKKIGVLKKCEHYHYIKFNVVVSRFGVGKVVQVPAGSKIKLGEELKLFRYKGEGAWDACIAEKNLEVEEGTPGEGLRIKSIKKPESKVFIKIKAPSGIIGYVPADRDLPQEFYTKSYDTNVESDCKK